VRIRLIRHATVRVEIGGRRVLVDPQLDPAGARPAVANTPNDRRNPLVELPELAESIAAEVEAVLVTHLHADHLDATAVEVLPKEVAVLCQPPDATGLRERGFVDVRPIEEALDWGALRLSRTNGRHGTGEIGERMAPVSGFVITTRDEPALYIAGDTIWCDEVREAVDRHKPEIIVANAGGARFLAGDPITMTADDVVALARHAPAARIVVVHLEAVNHCVETRMDLRARLRHEQLQERVSVPDDGDELPLS